MVNYTNSTQFRQGTGTWENNFMLKKPLIVKRPFPKTVREEPLLQNRYSTYSTINFLVATSVPFDITTM